jgi:hypothetical protein
MFEYTLTEWLILMGGLGVCIFAGIIYAIVKSK